MILEEFVTRKLGKEKLINLFMASVKKSGYEITRLEKADDTNPFEPFEIIATDGSKYTIHVCLKNISGAGWSDKPEIKRIQIKQLPELPRQRKKEFYILCGVCAYEETTLLAIWDPANYVTHNTVCSCYVYFSSLEKAMNNGAYHGLNKGKFVMTSREDSFGEVINEISGRYC